MVNQDPQPEVFETSFAFTTLADSAVQTNQIYTNQGHAEQVYIYAIGVDVYTTATGIASNFYDFDITISAGANNVPTNAFDGGFIYDSENQIVSLSCPIVVNFKQPLQVTIDLPGGGAATATTFEVTLIGETAILKR